MIGKKSNIATNNNLTDVNLDLMRLIKDFMMFIGLVTMIIGYDFSKKTYHPHAMK
jgi:hypothetical protein